MSNSNYSKESIIQILGTELAEKGLAITQKKQKLIPNTFYTSDILNYKGKTSDTKQYYTEIISEYLLENNFIDDNFPKTCTITREKSYYTKSHEKLEVSTDSNREEENFVKSLFFYNPFQDKIGKPIDFQTPLKNVKDDKAGKIDLLTYKKDTNELFIVEVKKENSEETLLRATLEVQTYYQTIDKDKLKQDFFNAKKINNKNVDIKKVIMIFKNSNLAKEYEENRKYIMQIIKELDIKVCILDVNTSIH